MANHPRLTQAQFEALAEQISLRSSPSSAAAELVLVHGLRPSDAARQAGVTPRAVDNALRRCRRGYLLAHTIVGAGQRA